MMMKFRSLIAPEHWVLEMAAKCRSVPDDANREPNGDGSGTDHRPLRVTKNPLKLDPRT